MPLLPFLLAALVLSWSGTFGAQWTVGVYMCADNGMSDQADVDLAEMKQVGSTEEVNVVVQVDRAARSALPNCYRYFIKQDGLDTLADLGEVDMADPATLTGFADFLRRRYPAKDYLLVLWDHGNGWYPGYGPGRAIFIDESHAHEMGVAGGELAQALADVKRALGRRVRVLAIDACLMGMMEIAAEANDACDYLLASEALVPADGLPYDKLLDRLTSRPTRPPAEFLPGLCREYVEQFPDQPVAIAALEMAGLDRLLNLLAVTVSDSIDAAGAALRQARASVLCMPGNSQHIDLIHLLELLPEPGLLLAELRAAIIASEHSAELQQAGGLAVWFPDNYLALKSRFESYATLNFARQTGWLRFLNRYFGADDLKPEQPAIRQRRQGNRSDIRIWWKSCFDLAPVRYSLYEAAGPKEVLNDYGNDLGAWIAFGWTVSAQQAHSGPTSFFSGSANNLSNFLESAEPLRLPGAGLLSLYTWYATQEDRDSLVGFTRDICYVEWSPDRGKWHKLDSLYGASPRWQETRYLLPRSDPCYLRFRYVTNASVNGQGVFLDDIKVYAFAALRAAAKDIPDTTATVFGVPRDTLGYSYLVTATDSFGNVSSASQFYRVEVRTWAEPYTRPAPFDQHPCKLVLDFPPGETPDVLIYTLSGALVYRFTGVSERMLDWGGCNQSGKPLADGLYLVVVQGKNFRRLGKIAKLTRR
ncbi:hypothetical protein FJY70_00045 [candidate division WOR-3 bacterium]|nr:hypothetical protein [candidate division WOR-3 bacterium]